MATAVLGLNLIKAYDRGGQRVEALNDVSLEVYPGEMVALIGRTGAASQLFSISLAVSIGRIPGG